MAKKKIISEKLAFDSYANNVGVKMIEYEDGRVELRTVSVWEDTAKKADGRYFVKNKEVAKRFVNSFAEDENHFDVIQAVKDLYENVVYHSDIAKRIYRP